MDWTSGGILCGGGFHPGSGGCIVYPQKHSAVPFEAAGGADGLRCAPAQSSAGILYGSAFFQGSGRQPAFDGKLKLDN